jgi:hypothetical protein
MQLGLCAILVMWHHIRLHVWHKLFSSGYYSFGVTFDYVTVEVPIAKST